MFFGKVPGECGIKLVWLSWVVFYGISILVGYSKPNPVYIYVYLHDL